MCGDVRVAWWRLGSQSRVAATIEGGRVLGSVDLYWVRMAFTEGLNEQQRKDGGLVLHSEHSE